MIALNITHDDDNAVAVLAMAMISKLAQSRAKGRSGWDTPECTQQHLSNLLHEHVAKGDPVDVANFCAFLTARGESIAPEQTTVYHCPHCGVLSDSPASTTAAAAPRAHPMKPSDLINSAGIIASDGPGEVVRKLDAAFDAAMVAAVARRGEYPHLPQSVGDVTDFGDGKVDIDWGHPAPVGGTRLYSADQMRAYVDADRAARAEQPASDAGSSEYPHEQMDAMALARYKVAPSHASMLWSHAVVAGDGAQQLYVGREVECQNMARKFAGAFLDGAFAFHSMAAAPTAQAAPALEAPAAPDLRKTRDKVGILHYLTPEQMAEEIVRLDARLAAAPQAPAAPWKDHQTARLVNDLRDCALKYHGAGQLRERIAYIVVPLCDQLKGALAAPAAPAVDALDSDRWRALEDQMDAGRVSLTVHHTEAEQWNGRTISDAGELQDYADSLAAQAKEGGEA